MGFSLSTLVKQKTWEGGKSQSIFRKLTGRVEGRGRGRDETGRRGIEVEMVEMDVR